MRWSRSRSAAAMLADRIDSRVEIGYVATGTPKVADIVERLRAGGAQRVFIASYLLAHGLFHQRLADAGADGVAEPLGGAPERALLGDGVERRKRATHRVTGSTGKLDEWTRRNVNPSFPSRCLPIVFAGRRCASERGGARDHGVGRC